MLTKEQLGFTPYNFELFHKIIQALEGIILVTGPTVQENLQPCILC